MESLTSESFRVECVVVGKTDGSRVDVIATMLHHDSATKAIVDHVDARGKRQRTHSIFSINLSS